MSANEATPANYAPEFYGRQHATTLRPHEPMHPRGACADCDEAYGWMIQQGASFPPRAVLYNEPPEMPASVRRTSNRLFLSIGIVALMMVAGVVSLLCQRPDVGAVIAIVLAVALIVNVASADNPTW